MPAAGERVSRGHASLASMRCAGRPPCGARARVCARAPWPACAWTRHACAEAPEQLKVVRCGEQVHDVSNKNSVVTIRNRVFEEISSHDLCPLPAGIARETLPSDRGCVGQLEQGCLKRRVMP